MKLILIFATLLLTSCDLFDEDKKAIKTLQKNIAIVTNQGSGYLTVIDLTNQTIIEEVNLSEKLQAYSDKGGNVDAAYIDKPVPHYVQTSFDGKYVYVIHTNRQGAISKLDAEFNVLAFHSIEGTTYPAHMQLTKDNKEIYISTWTTNMGALLEANNFMIHLDARDLHEIDRVATPAGAHGIKLTPDENKIIIGHDLIDYVSIIKGGSHKQLAVRENAATTLNEADKNSGKILSPTQLGITPDGKFAFFSCKEASKLLVFNLATEDTVGFVDLKTAFDIDENLAPYSVEVGPKENYETSTEKYAYVNFKVGGYLARLSIDPEATTANTILTADTIMSLSDTDARPHGLDITNDGKIAVVSAEYLKSDNTQAKTYIIDLENWKMLKEFNTKIHSRGLCIYPSTGN